MDTDNQLLVNKMVLRALERMDLMGTVPPMSVSKGLTNTGDTNDREKAEIFLDLLTLTDVDNIDLETGQLKDGVELLTDTGRRYNNPQTINQLYERSGFTGRGRTDQEAEELGLTSDYDASPGDVFQNEVENDKRFASRLYDGTASTTHAFDRDAFDRYEDFTTVKPDAVHSFLNNIPGVGSVANYIFGEPDDNNYDSEREDKAFNSHSPENLWNEGWMGASGRLLSSLSDSSGTWSENPAGRLFSAMSDGPYSHVTHSLAGRDEELHGDSTPYTFLNDWIDRESPVYQKAETENVLDGLRDKPSTPMPDEHSGSWLDRQRHIGSVNEAADNSAADLYRDQYRSKYKEYPSKAKEFAVDIGAEIADFGAPISFLAGALTSPGILPKVINGLKWMGKELVTEDLPIGAGIKGAVEVASPNTPRTLEGWTSSERLDLPRQTNEEHQSDLLDARKKRDASSAFAKKYAEGLGS